MASRSWMPLAMLGLAACNGAHGALTVDVNDSNSVKQAAAAVAADLMSFYKGSEKGEIIGVLPGPPPVGDYYWWESGLMWGTLLEYGSLSGNTTYNSQVRDGLLWQRGDNNFMPANWTATLGNDDMGFWGVASAIASATGLENPSGSDPSWFQLAQTVSELLESDQRKAGDSCADLLRWQIVPFNQGYEWVGSLSNAMSFNLAARINAMKSNDTQASQATQIFKNLQKAGLITDDYAVYDGVSAAENCSTDRISKLQFSAPAAALLEGAAMMYNKTSDSTWKGHVDGLVKSMLATFFPKGIAFEAACEGVGNCNTDMQSYKGIAHRALASTMRLAPYTRDTILPVLKTSAAAAVKTCSQGDNGRMCSFVWAEGGDKSRRQADNETDDGTTGSSKPASVNASIQMNVLSALMSLMEGAPGNGTQTTGGNGSSGSGTGSGTKTSSTSASTNAAVTIGVTGGARIAGYVGTGAAFVAALM